MQNWLEISAEKDIEELTKQSFHPDLLGVVIFKHSTRCSISAMAKSRLERKWTFSNEKLPLYYLDLLSHREISNKIASDFNVKHESPQMLLIKNGKCIYHSSHSEISEEHLQGFLRLNN